VPHRGAHAVRAGVAAADDDDVLAGGVNEAAVLVPSRMLFVFAVRKSIAKWMPLSSRPGIGRSRGLVAPVARMTASNSFNSFSAG
jgi:hypothetical protein